MALIVEDGSGVAGANSYVSDSDYTAYAAQRNLTVGADATERESELIRAMDYIEKHRGRFKGYKTSPHQALQWPRSGVYIDGNLISSNVIPQELKAAQMEAAVAVSADINLLPTGSYQNIQSQSIGDLSVSYFSGGSWSSLQLDSVKASLNELLVNGGSCHRLIRV